VSKKAWNLLLLPEGRNAKMAYWNPALSSANASLLAA
jgi:hypothetical protein